MRHILVSFLLVSLVLGGLTVSLFGQPMIPTDTSRKGFSIKPGQSLDQIASNLSQAKLIRSRLVFKLTVFRLNLSQKIQAGYFSLSPSQNTESIAQSLTKAQAEQIWITVPEGLRREEVANLILDKLAASGKSHRYNPDEFLRLTTKLEGHLFPDTYAFSPDVTTTQVLEKLTSQFDKVIASLNIASKDLNRILTLASLVEREAGSDAERPEIAGIIVKRAASNWALQVDATVQYALSSSRCRIRICDWWPTPLTKIDLTINSPYNTYKNTGFPPGPIDNPGKASLSAATKPNTTKNWFYLHDLSGQVHYAVTIEEHNKNVCTYLKKDC